MQAMPRKRVFFLKPATSHDTGRFVLFCWSSTKKCICYCHQCDTCASQDSRRQGCCRRVVAGSWSRTQRVSRGQVTGHEGGKLLGSSSAARSARLRGLTSQFESFSWRSSCCVDHRDALTFEETDTHKNVCKNDFFVYIFTELFSWYD